MNGVSMFNTTNQYVNKYTKTGKPEDGLGQGSIGSQAAGGQLTINDFYKLLATQLQYQDADNPMDTAEMMNQMVQTQMSQTIAYMTTAISDMSTVNLITYASSMMGKEVTVMEVDEDGNPTKETRTGVVTGVTLDGAPFIYIDGEKYSIMQIMSIGDVPDESDGGDVDPGFPVDPNRPIDPGFPVDPENPTNPDKRYLW